MVTLGQQHDRGRRQRRQRRVGISLMLTSLAVGGASLFSAPAVGAAESEAEQLEIDATALYASPPTEVIPDTLTDEFPPGVVCVLFPNFCKDETQELRDAIGGVIEEGEENAPAEPVQPVPPGSIAMNLLGGKTRYQSAIRFELPEVPEGQVVDSFVITLAQDQPTYNLNSPAFRQAVFAAIKAAGDSNPQLFVEEFRKIVEEGDKYPPVDESVIGLEACPFTKPFEPGGAPQAQDREEIPSQGEGTERELAIDCILGANGVYDAKTATWSFDLTYALNAWAAGDLENHGVLIRPGAAANLAFGDEDTSTNAQVVLEAETVEGELATSPAPAPIQPFTPPPPPASTDVAGTTGPTFTPGTPGTPGVTTTVGGGIPTGGFAPGPDVAPPATTPPPAQVAPPAQPLAAAPAGAVPATPWWVWTLVPVFGAGMWLTSQSLTAEATAAVGGGRPGAMSRLIERRRGPSAPPPSQV